MKVIEARNVHEALPKALWLLEQCRIGCASRNGPVYKAPCPVSTVYHRPYERVVFWSQRDANPFFHLYESLWMLAGRRDLAPLTRYVSDFGKFSDDGETLHGAYGARWRRYPDADRSLSDTHMTADQLDVIAERLRADPDDRRCVLQMWDARFDLGTHGKDVPCNTVATFQRRGDGALDLVVFCRSNDILWGAYGANAVHFSMLQEYMALWIGCAVGSYTQISVNWHAYLNQLEKMKDLTAAATGLYAQQASIWNPYATRDVRALPLTERRTGEAPADTIRRLDEYILELLTHADTGFGLPRLKGDDEPFIEAAYHVLRAHEFWRTIPRPDGYAAALAELKLADGAVDWVQAARQWVVKRQKLWESKQAVTS